MADATTTEQKKRPQRNVGYKPSTVYKQIPEFKPLKEFKGAAQVEQFIQKMEECCKETDWNIDAPKDHVVWRDRKTTHLNDLLTYITDATNNPNPFPIETWPYVVHLIYTNIFRPLSPPDVITLILLEEDEEEPLYALNWTHIQCVYEILLRFILCQQVDPKKAGVGISLPNYKGFRQDQQAVKEYKEKVVEGVIPIISPSFVLTLMATFDTEDPRERDYLKSCLHRIYARYAVHRVLIRNTMALIFTRVSYEPFHFRFNGMPELLDIIGSIITGYSVPVKDENRQFIKRTLLPLHRSKMLYSFHKQLSAAIVQYLKKDPSLTHQVLSYLVDKIWPKVATGKQSLFLAEIEDIFDSTPTEEIAGPDAEQKHPDPNSYPLHLRLFRRMGECIESSHFKVAERSLTCFANQSVVNVIKKCKQDVIPLIFLPLYQCTHTHWAKSVKDLAYGVLKLLQQTDGKLFATVASTAKANNDRRLKSGLSDFDWVTVERKAVRKVIDDVLNADTGIVSAGEVLSEDDDGGAPPASQGNALPIPKFLDSSIFSEEAIKNFSKEEEAVVEYISMLNFSNLVQPQNSTSIFAYDGITSTTPTSPTGKSVKSPRGTATLARSPSPTGKGDAASVELAERLQASSIAFVQQMPSYTATLTLPPLKEVLLHLTAHPPPSATSPTGQSGLKKEAGMVSSSSLLTLGLGALTDDADDTDAGAPMPNAAILAQQRNLVQQRQNKTRRKSIVKGSAAQAAAQSAAIQTLLSGGSALVLPDDDGAPNPNVQKPVAELPAQAQSPIARMADNAEHAGVGAGAGAGAGAAAGAGTDMTIDDDGMEMPNIQEVVEARKAYNRGIRRKSVVPLKKQPTDQQSVAAVAASSLLLQVSPSLTPDVAPVSPISRGSPAPGFPVPSTSSPVPGPSPGPGSSSPSSPLVSGSTVVAPATSSSTSSASSSASSSPPTTSASGASSSSPSSSPTVVPKVAGKGPVKLIRRTSGSSLQALAAVSVTTLKLPTPTVPTSISSTSSSASAASTSSSPTTPTTSASSSSSSSSPGSPATPATTGAAGTPGHATSPGISPNAVHTPVSKSRTTNAVNPSPKRGNTPTHSTRTTSSSTTALGLAHSKVASSTSPTSTGTGAVPKTKSKAKTVGRKK